MIKSLQQHYEYISESVGTKNLTQILVWTHNLMGFYSFHRLAKRMQASEAGKDILKKRPRVTNAIIRSYKLEGLPNESFGRLFFNFVTENGFDREVRTPPRSPFENELTGYAKTRWRETHDFRHILTGFSASLADEAIIAAFQFGNLPNGWSLVVMMIAPLLSWRQLHPAKQWYRMVEAYKAGRDAVCLGSVSYEGELHTPIEELRKKWRVKNLSHLSSRFP